MVKSLNLCNIYLFLCLPSDLPLKSAAELVFLANSFDLRIDWYKIVMGANQFFGGLFWGSPSFHLHGYQVLLLWKCKI